MFRFLQTSMIPSILWTNYAHATVTVIFYTFLVPFRDHGHVSSGR